MTAQATLLTDELVLRPPQTADASAIQLLAGDERIADTTANIPHPYPDGAAHDWLREVAAATLAGDQLVYAITLAREAQLVGIVSLMDINDAEAELGYWIGVPYWGRGIATGAVACLLEHAFSQMGLRRIHARVLSRNPASARVLLRLGFTHTGTAINTCGYRRQREPTEYYQLLSPLRTEPG
jgi:ribosomal-protein-alanine N-acetyltransferase